MWFTDYCFHGITQPQRGRVHSHYGFTDTDMDVEKMNVKCFKKLSVLRNMVKLVTMVASWLNSS